MIVVKILKNSHIFSIIFTRMLQIVMADEHEFYVLQLQFPSLIDNAFMHNMKYVQNYFLK